MRRAAKLSKALEPVCTEHKLQQDGTAVYNPETKCWRTYKSVRGLLHDIILGEFGEL